ncbi:hypothetical protein [Brucella thiophenivorans]|uniref:Uncharacterized protein n=1 Tax=Brucella thiophenivorans TaxID=571255 RepID=A0A256FN64_9HYPH|nr:hypothetical protein [Brucella thiophenivorans]OYR16259.1 hypothetical protein CEV31_4408 [Brucella thiophenivorans]
MSVLKSTRAQITTAATVFIALSMQQAIPSSDDAWDEFRNDVEQSCTKAVSEMMTIEDIKVDPYGSETFGFAIIKGFEKDNKDEQQVVCVFDKKSKMVEISGFFDK